MTYIPLCKDCAHQKYKGATRFCRRPGTGRVNLEDGKIKYSLCCYERLNTFSSDRCGPEGKYFEPRKEKWYDAFIGWMY